MTYLASQSGAGDDHVFLVGRPPPSEFLGFIRTMAVNGQTADQGQLAAEWRKANDYVKTLEAKEVGLADGAPIEDLPTGLAHLADEFLKDSFYLRSFSLIPARLGVVDLDRLVVYQKFIDLTYVGQLKKQLGSKPTPEQVFRFCLPTQRTLPQVSLKQTATNSYTFVSPSNDLRFLEAIIMSPSQLTGFQSQGPAVAIVGLIVGYGSNFLNVAHIENRLILGNGSHRAFALRELGLTQVPCIIQEVSRSEEIEMLGFGELQQNQDRYLKSPRPPLLKDYFDSALRKIVPVARKHRLVRVSFGVETSDIPAN